MSEVTFVNQVAVGDTNPHALSELFPSLKSGVSYSLKCVSGTMYVKHDNTVDSTNGWPLETGASLSIDGGNPRKLWVRGASAADRVSVAVVT